MTKICSKWNKDLDEESFYRPPSKAQLTYCRPCSNARRKVYYGKSKEKLLSITRAHYRKNADKLKYYAWERALKREYGITPAEYNEKLEEQDGVCAICNQPQILNRRLSVDHEHETGKVRGLLCLNCNSALALFRESTDRMHAAIFYLCEYGCAGKV